MKREINEAILIMVILTRFPYLSQQVKHALLIFLFLPAVTLAQTNYQKLIVAEYRIDSSGIGNYTYLVSYNFLKGVFVSKDTLFGAETNKEGVAGSYVRYDLGRNFVYKNRYVISGTGNVIDTKTKRLVIEESDDLVETKGDTLVFHRSNFLTGTGFLVLDLRNGSYHFINHKDWDHGRDKSYSPDSLHYLTVDKSKIPYKIWLYNKEGKGKVVVADAAHGPSTSDAEFPTVEKVWLNNDNFLYAIHKPVGYDNTNISGHESFVLLRQISQVSLREYNINNGVDTPFFVLDSVKSEMNGRFFRDNIGQLIYRTSAGTHYVVDTTNRRLNEYRFQELGQEFSFSNEYLAEGHIIRYRDSVIGQIWCSRPTVTRHAIAVEYGRRGSNLGYPKGIQVWTGNTGSWTSFDIPWLCSLIGWIDERE